MAYAKVKETLLDGSRSLQGIVVISDSFYAAHSFGERGYDEGDLKEYRMVPAESVIKNPISHANLLELVKAIGIDASEEDSPNGLLTNPIVRDEVERRGFDGFAGMEVIGNMAYDVSIVWEGDRVKLQPEPTGMADFATEHGDGGELIIRVMTARGREAIHRAMDEFEGHIDQESAYVFSKIGVSLGYTFEPETAVSPDGFRYQLGHDAAHELLEEGVVVFQEDPPTLGFGL
jgi:hypothetical protein